MQERESTDCAFFTVQQQESNRLKTECRQDMDGWLVSGEPTVGLAV